MRPGPKGSNLPSTAKPSQVYPVPVQSQEDLSITEMPDGVGTGET